MASALARGLGEPIVVSDIDRARAEALAREVGGEVAGSNVSAAADADAVVLAHKPAQLAGVAGHHGGAHDPRPPRQRGPRGPRRPRPGAESHPDRAPGRLCVRRPGPRGAEGRTGRVGPLCASVGTPSGSARPRGERHRACGRGPDQRRVTEGLAPARAHPRGRGTGHPRGPR